jgi:hypothetical protein
MSEVLYAVVCTGWLANLDRLKHWIAAVAETNCTGAEMHIG